MMSPPSLYSCYWLSLSVIWYHNIAVCVWLYFWTHFSGTVVPWLCHAMPSLYQLSPLPMNWVTDSLYLIKSGRFSCWCSFQLLPSFLFAIVSPSYRTVYWVAMYKGPVMLSFLTNPRVNVHKNQHGFIESVLVVATGWPGQVLLLLMLVVVSVLLGGEWVCFKT